MEWSKIIQQLFQLAEPYLAARGDKPHIEVAHTFALSLMEREGGNYKIIEPAIILHDVGWSCLPPEQLNAAYGMGLEGKSSNKLNRIHEKEGAAIARKILESTGFDTHLIDKITQIIERHDSGCDAHSIEEKIVKDADKLWRYSDIGFWYEIERQALVPKEYYDYLALRCQTYFFTQTARTLAKKELERRFKEIGALNNKMAK
ncbi:MAG: HD domain-containing protein [Desulfobacterales bacterium]|jgi:HD superfamily phosphodiesterase